MAGERPLDSIRADIRQLDDEILRLVGKRLELAREVGAVKRAKSLPIKDYRVEKDVIDRARIRGAELGVYPETAESVARLLIEHAVRAQDELHREASRRERKSEQKRVVVVGGRGGMGRWVTEFFESFGHEVQHCDRKEAPPAPQTLIESLEDAAASADIIVLSTPISVTPPLLERLTAMQAPGLVFDICSLKTPLVPALQAAARAGLRVTSVHPMFGPSARLLAGRNIIVCEVNDSPGAKAAASAASELFADTTAQLVEMPLARHDELMGIVLGLSHLSSLVFAEALALSGVPHAELHRVASTTFQAQLGVTVPVTSENQDLYFEIQDQNRHTPETIATLRAALTSYAEALGKRDRAGFKRLMQRGKSYLGPG